MTAKSPVTVLPEAALMIVGDAMSAGGEDLGMLLIGQRRRRHEAVLVDRERDLNISRSGSAPPTVNGSLSAVGGLFRQSSMLSGGNGNYSIPNLNPRLSTTATSNEDWRIVQRVHRSNASSGDGDESRSLFSMQTGFSLQSEDHPAEPVGGEWSLKGGVAAAAGPPGFPPVRHKSFAEIFKDDLGQTTLSRPSSSNTLNASMERLESTEIPVASHRRVGCFEEYLGGGATMVSNVQSVGRPTSQTFASVLSPSLSRSNTPDPQLITRARSPCLPPVGSHLGSLDKKNSNGSGSSGSIPTRVIDSNNSLVEAFMGMKLPANEEVNKESCRLPDILREFDDRLTFISDEQNSHGHVNEHSSSSSIRTPGMSTRRTSVSPSCGPNVDCSSASNTSISLGGFSLDPALSTMMASRNDLGNQSHLRDNHIASSPMVSLGLKARATGVLASGRNPDGATDLQTLSTLGNHAIGDALRIPLVDPLYTQYFRNTGYAAQASANFGEHVLENGYLADSYADVFGIQKAAYLGRYSDPYLGKSGCLANGLYGNSNFTPGFSYSGVALASTVFPCSLVGPRNAVRHVEPQACYSYGMRNIAAGSWPMSSNGPNGGMVDILAASLLEEFKSNKVKCSELLDIEGHIFEFSVDQYGSRFIQQKLETATTEEKDMVFKEIMPHALSLMTDVFGNYVIQKFFEHGAKSQIRELADKLKGNVLALSMQMYGCRVIQKAVEVVELDQQTKMAMELDGHVMRCVRDQNGNHVIQKCIECIPEEAIRFIISTFYDQIVALSTHPYGCRIIQRVLEHCRDTKTQKIVMDEIMRCVCMLTQDQYGNYVVQHVLKFGKPDERSVIIEKLAGRIVQMSRQKFASNVVEKCLTYGGPEERQLLVSEMLGSTEENEPLQEMMKDQFANYVVQKVLETCNDQQRELILSRVKVHLSALKKYTYGKHIVARVEKLVAAGEKRIGIQSS